MKPRLSNATPAPSSDNRLLNMKTIATLTLLSFLALPATLCAQTADGFDTSGMVPAAPAADANAKAAAKPAAAPAPAARTAAPAATAPGAADAEAMMKIPSRYAGTTGPELAAYVETLSSRFAIRRAGNQATDVFGRFQDPTYVPDKPLPKANDKNPRGPMAIPKVPFSDVVAAIEVNTIDLAKKRFLVGSREFRVGSVLTLKLPTGGKYVKAQVTSVSSQSIGFRNPETNETAAKRMETMPSGMSRGTGDISAPGMSRVGENTPLEVEVAPAAPLLAR